MLELIIRSGEDAEESSGSEAEFLSLLKELTKCPLQALLNCRASTSDALCVCGVAMAQCMLVQWKLQRYELTEIKQEVRAIMSSVENKTSASF